MKWQPIATAPRDGTRILLLRPHARGGNAIEMGVWDTQPYHATPKPLFCYESGFGIAYARKWQPTRWMPLPLDEVPDV